MSALALLYMALTQRLSKRYSTKWLYYAWLVVIIGLIIPFRPNLDYAVIRIDVPTIIGADYQAENPLVIPPGNNESTGSPDSSNVEQRPVTPSNNPDIIPVDIPWETIIIALWMVGAVVFLICHVVKHKRFIHSIWRWGEDVNDDRTLSILQRVKEEMSITKTICLQQSELVGSPLLTGIQYPRIMLPKVDIPDDEMALVLKHELVHYKRKDVWYKGLVLFTVALHWFNPIVYVIARRIGIQCEKSCDDEVIKYKDADTRLHYCKTIINSIRSAKPATALSTTFYGGKKEMKSRITSIMDMSRKKRGTIVICAALILSLVIGATFAINAAAPPEEVEDPSVFDSVNSPDDITPQHAPLDEEDEVVEEGDDQAISKQPYQQVLSDEFLEFFTNIEFVMFYDEVGVYCDDTFNELEALVLKDLSNHAAYSYGASIGLYLRFLEDPDEVLMFFTLVGDFIIRGEPARLRLCQSIANAAVYWNDVNTFMGADPLDSFRAHLDLLGETYQSGEIADLIELIRVQFEETVINYHEMYGHQHSD